MLDEKLRNKIGSTIFLFFLGSEIGLDKIV